ncbi:MAG: hypothetical protein K2M72_07525 [Paramuribaculum sp.]|nr:hypothetical protein [Paramuribaculum sp.]
MKTLGTVRTYGSHEELYYMRSGNQLTAIGASVAGAAYEGRTGIGEEGTWDYIIRCKRQCLCRWHT